MNTIWLLAISLVLVLQGIELRHIEKNQKAFESWYPFCEIMKMKICKGCDRGDNND